MVTFKNGDNDSGNDWKNQDFIASYRVSSGWSICLVIFQPGHVLYV